MKRALFAIGLGMLFAGCGERETETLPADQAAAPPATSDTRVSPNAGSGDMSTTPVTTERAGPDTGVGAGAAGSTGVGTATASGASAVESHTPDLRSTNTAPSNPPLPQ